MSPLAPLPSALRPRACASASRSPPLPACPPCALCPTQDLAGLPPPQQQDAQELNGTSLQPLFLSASAQVKDAAFSQFAKNDLFSVFNKFKRPQARHPPRLALCSPELMQRGGHLSRQTD